VAAITDLSDLVNLATNGGAAPPQNAFFYKVARVGGAAAPATIAGRAASLWTYDGHPSAGAVPGAASAPTRATAGALPLVNAGGTRELWLVQAWATSLVGGTLLLYDRLLHNGGLSGTVTTAQTVGGTLTRNTGGEGNFALVEIYSAVGTTATTVTASYTNQDGTSGRTTTAVAIGGTGFREQTRAILLPLQSGDSGVRAVASITLAASTGTAGSIGVTIGRPLAYVGIGAAGAPGWRDFVTGTPGLPRIDNDACLSLLWIPATTTSPELIGGYFVVEK
jgi:hypothetical protein